MHDDSVVPILLPRPRTHSRTQTPTFFLHEITPAFDDKNSEESHLDLTLEEEASFVDEYRTLIATRSQLDER